MSRGKHYIKVREAAGRIGVPVAWLKREADSGRLPSIRVGRSRMFDIEAVLRALADWKDHEVRTAPELSVDPIASLPGRAAVKGGGH